MIKQVIVVRKDLNMRKGKMIAQGAHASLKVLSDNIYSKGSTELGGVGGRFQEYMIDLTDDMERWLDGDYTKIVVYVESKEELLRLKEEAEDLGLPTGLVLDQGRTEFDKETYTALAVGPAKAEKVDQVTGELNLL